jgi:transposase-like protein
LKAAADKVLDATIQRCRVHFMRNALACVGKKDKPIVTAALRTAFEADSKMAANEKWGSLINAFEARYPKLAELMTRAEEDVLAYNVNGSLKLTHFCFDRRLHSEPSFCRSFSGH